MLLKHFSSLPATLTSSDYLTQCTQDVSRLLLESACPNQLSLPPLTHLVASTTLLQHLLYTTPLPAALAHRLSLLVRSTLTQQSLATLRQLKEDALGSPAISQFYQNVFLSAFGYRAEEMGRICGVALGKELPETMLRLLLDRPECDGLPITSEWILLCCIYYTLFSKYDPSNEKPVLARLLHRLSSSRRPSEARQPLPGDHLALFYNAHFLPQLESLDPRELDRMLEAMAVERETVGDLVVCPIQNENNTVLDNIVFSSSMEPWEH